MKTKQAKDFLVQQTTEQATRENIPLSDIEIGEIMQISRQQVINLRKTARERLRRRMDQVHLASTSDGQRNNSGGSMYKGKR